MLSSYYKAKERGISFMLIVSSIGQSSTFQENETLCKTPLEGRKALHTVQNRQVVVDKFAEVKLSAPWSFKMVENHYMPQTKVDWISNNASSQFKLWRKEVERIIGSSLASRSD